MVRAASTKRGSSGGLGWRMPSPASKLTTINSNATSSARWRDEEAAMAGDTRTP